MANRQAIVWISFPLLQEIITVGWRGNAECIKGVPAGAQLVRTFTDDQREIAALVFEHESFDEVVLGDELPVLPIVHRTVTNE